MINQEGELVRRVGSLGSLKRGLVSKNKFLPFSESEHLGHFDARSSLTFKCVKDRVFVIFEFSLSVENEDFCDPSK